MILTDTHTHLYSDEFSEDQDMMMQRALEAGIERFFVPSIDSTFADKMYAIEAKYPKNVFLMMGLHPTHVNESVESELAFVEAELARRHFYAIGEIGIDLFWDNTFLEQQKYAFQKQIQLAKKYKLPINIHCRAAFDAVFEVLKAEQSPELFGIFHCFTGTYEHALEAISYNMKLGIGGVATFKNGKIDQFLNKIALSNIVLETDSPYLAPVPYRGKRNESSYLVTVARKLAALYGTSPEHIAAVTTQNSKAVFGI
jgi:TatD DNase family protein